MARAKTRQEARTRRPRSVRNRTRGVEVGSPAYGKIEAVVRLLPTNGDQVTSGWLLRRLKESQRTPRRTAIRWLKEAEAYVPPGHHYPLVKSVKSGRSRLYGFNPTGLMGPEETEWFLKGAPIGFLREAPKLVEEYGGSLETMTLFWEQASTALTLSMERVIAAAQSVTFAQVHDRMSPSADVARAQADVLAEVFVKPWVQSLVVTLHQFLEVERTKNRATRRLANNSLGAPSAMEAFRKGWHWAGGPEGAAHSLWISKMKGPEAGPWGAFLERVQREEQERMRSLHEEAVASESMAPEAMPGGEAPGS